MFDDTEKTLVRELREVADGLQVPPMPALSQEPPRVRRYWRPALAAASVLLVAAGVVAVTTQDRAGQRVDPAPSPPTPSRTESPAAVPTTPSGVPYVLDQRLYVDGEQVPGAWWRVWAGGDGWLAIRTDDTWWWGRGPEPRPLTGERNQPPAISPNGRYVAEVLLDEDRAVLNGLDTSAGGRRVGSVPVDLGDPSYVLVRAVTDDGRVIVQGESGSLLWLPLVDNRTVDLTVTEPGLRILGGTPAGVVATDAENEEPYLAEISDDGELTRIGAVPPHDDILVSPEGRWLATVAAGSLGGEVESVSEIAVQSLDGRQRATLTAPTGWRFGVHAWAWEDDDHLVSRVVGDRGERTVRCRVESAVCVLIESP